VYSLRLAVRSFEIVGKLVEMMVASVVARNRVRADPMCARSNLAVDRLGLFVPRVVDVDRAGLLEISKPASLECAVVMWVGVEERLSVGIGVRGSSLVEGLLQSSDGGDGGVEIFCGDMRLS
jgi:hypothetical protein